MRAPPLLERGHTGKRRFQTSCVATPRREAHLRGSAAQGERKAESDKGKDHRGRWD